MKKRALPSYFVTVLFFLLFLVGCLGVFFVRIDAHLYSLTVNGIIRTIRQQNTSLTAMLNTQLSALRAMAAYMTDEAQTDAPQRTAVAKALSGSSGFSRVLVADAAGNAVYSDGQQGSVADKAYFASAMQGRESLSDPVRSEQDGHTRVILCVPVYDSAGRVKGALAAAYDMNRLSEIMYDSAYGGYGYFLIAARDGEVVAADSRQAGGVPDNFFAAWEGIAFKKSASLARVQSDFARGAAGGFFAEQKGGGRYVAYAPLSVNDWMMCYVVDETYVQTNYGFIRTEEALLISEALLGVCALLIVVFLATGRDRRRLERRARTDLLTGLLNKESTRLAATRLLQRSREKDVHALMILDLDDFKKVNDTCGHAAGDVMLCHAAQFLASSFRERDVVGRVGGDEFMVFLYDVKDARQMGEHLSAVIAQYNRLPPPEGCSMQPRCSAGIAFYPQDGRDFDTLYKKADAALYRAKGSGKCQTATFEEDGGAQSAGR